MMQANGRWRAYFVLSMVNSVAFVTCCVIGVKAGGPIGMAWGVVVFYALFGVTQLLFATAGRCDGRGPRIVRLYAAPVAVAGGICLGLAAGARALAMPPALALPVLAVAGAVLIGLTLRVVCPVRVAHLGAQLPVARLVGRLRRGRPAPTD